MRELVICAPVRTAIGTYNGTLKETPAVELGAAAIKACLERAALSGAQIGTVIAHGHPIGATGAIQTTRLLYSMQHSMQRDGLKRGVVTMCIGGGQGIALCLEPVP